MRTPDASTARTALETAYRHESAPMRRPSWSSIARLPSPCATVHRPGSRSLRRSSPGAVPDHECKAFGDELRARGQFLGGEPLHPTYAATVVRVRNGVAALTDGPFAETKELIAGHTIIDVKSRDEAVDWARKLRNPQGRGKSTYIEVRPFFELDDFEPGEGIDRFRELEARTR